MNMMRHIKEAVAEQHKQTALVNCFATWDDGTDLDVIEQGLLDRLVAIGRPAEGIRIQRKSLSLIEIDTPEGMLCTIHNFPTIHSTDVYWTGEKILSAAEERKMATWLMENFYHTR